MARSRFGSCESQVQLRALNRRAGQKDNSDREFLFPMQEYESFKPPVLISACFLGIPCRWHGRPAKRRDELIAKLKEKYVLVPVCPEQLGGMPTPRTGEQLDGWTGAQVLDGRARIVAPETGEDVTRYHLDGAKHTVTIAKTVGGMRAYLKGGSPSCVKNGVTGEALRRAGIKVICVP